MLSTFATSELGIFFSNILSRKTSPFGNHRCGNDYLSAAQNGRRLWVTVPSPTANLWFCEKSFSSPDSTHWAEFFPRLSVTTADKGNVNLMLISAGYSITAVFYAYKIALIDILANLVAPGGRGGYNLKPSRFVAPLRGDKPIKYDSVVLSKSCLCVAQNNNNNNNKISLSYFVLLAPSVLPVICGNWSSSMARVEEDGGWAGGHLLCLCCPGYSSVIAALGAN